MTRDKHPMAPSILNRIDEVRTHNAIDRALWVKKVKDSNKAHPDSTERAHRKSIEAKRARRIKITLPKVSI
jgi:hypothetical protein